MAGPKYQPPLEDAADTETEETAGHAHRGEWQRAAHDAQRDPVHESLQKARERVHGEGSDSDSDAAPQGETSEVTRRLRSETGERPGELECSQFAPPKDADEAGS